jgi:hypothetical protein
MIKMGPELVRSTKMNENKTKHAACPEADAFPLKI